MIHILATFSIPAENQADFVKLAKELVGETLKEAGNVSYDLVQGIADPTRFTFIEKWADQAAVDAHNASTHFTKLIPEMVKLASAAPEISLLKPVF